MSEPCRSPKQSRDLCMRCLAILLLVGEQVGDTEQHPQGRDHQHLLLPLLLAVPFLGGDQAPERPQHWWALWEDGSALRHPHRSGVRAQGPAWSQPGLLWIPRTAQSSLELPCSVLAFGEQESTWRGTAQSWFCSIFYMFGGVCIKIFP